MGETETRPGGTAVAAAGGGIFTAAERRAFAPPEKLTPSQWAERFRYLTPDIAAEPGPSRFARVPDLGGIIDAICEPDLEEIVILKAAQIGYSATIQNLIGWMVDQEPAPALFVMPTQDAANNLVNEQFKPLIESSAQLKGHLIDGRFAVTKDSARFDTMPIYLGWAGSAQTLASRALRYVFLDEIDKFVAVSGKEGDPISLARKRGSTFQHRRRMVMGCTPTTRENHIWRQWESCGDRRRYHVPCPHCGEFQVLVFGQLRFDFDDVKAIQDRPARADYVEAKRRALYECLHCKQLIVSEAKPDMLARGRWLSETQTIDRAGVIRGERPRSKRVGFHISALYSPWVSFPQMAAQFLRAVGNPGAMREFKNQWLAEVFEDIAQRFEVSDIRDKLANAAPAAIAPKWAGLAISTVDVQANRFYFVNRAWGRGMRSRLLHFGEVATFQEVTRLCLNTPFAVDGHPGEFLLPVLLFCDSGYRTDEVYQFSLTDHRIRPVKGMPTKSPHGQLFAWSAPMKDARVNLGMINTSYFKDALATLRGSGQWEVNDAVTEEYMRHMASEAKMRDAAGQLSWEPISSGAANHYLDCEVYQVAAATFLHVHESVPDEATLDAMRGQASAEREAIRRGGVAGSSSDYGAQAAEADRQLRGSGDDWAGGGGGGGWL